jgi:hypothetical protein
MPSVPATSSSALAVCRALAQAGAGDTLSAFAGAFEGVGVAGAMSTMADGLQALLEGNAAGAAVDLARAENDLRTFGRAYDAACVALDTARALEAAEEPERAQKARDRATPLLERLGCVNPW